MEARMEELNIREPPPDRRRNVDFSELYMTTPIRKHLMKVYAYFLCGVLCTAISAYISINFFASSFERLSYKVSGIILYAIVVGIVEYVGKTKNKPTKLAGSAIATAIMGWSCSPLLFYITGRLSRGLNMLYRALAVSLLAFITTSVIALTSRSRKWLFLGGPISAFLMLHFVDWVFLAANGRPLMSLKFDASIGLVVFTLKIIYDTQNIIEMKRSGDHDAIQHAVVLVFSFVHVFIVIAAMKMLNNSNKY